VTIKPGIDPVQEQLHLPDGRVIDFEIRSSSKARSLRLKISVRDGLVVVVPNGIEQTRVMQLVASKSEWIAERFSDFDAMRHLVVESAPVRPQAFDLPALAESWRIEYRATKSKTVGARTDQMGRIVIAGAIHDEEACQAALRRWLARHAKEALAPWLNNVAQQTGMKYTDLVVKNQRTRWGSCTLQGRISLNCKLLFLPRDQVHYVIMHELCHTLVHSHSSRFWTHLHQFEPNTDLLHGKMRDAWKFVPAWAQRGSEAML
jgi:predicted metal-dependent hydrolase